MPLAWARSQAVRESDETVWLAQESFDDYNLLAASCGNWCPFCDGLPDQYECRVARQGGILDGARRGLDEPAWVAAYAAFYAVELENPAAEGAREGPLWEWEWKSIFATAREVLGEDEPNAEWPRWRTSDVRALARGIHHDQAFDRLPILADALQDAGCASEDVLAHCRDPKQLHVRGCWVIDLLTGRG